MTIKRRVRSEDRPIGHRRMPAESLFRAKLGLALLVSVVLVGSIVSAPVSPTATRESVR